MGYEAYLLHCSIPYRNVPLSHDDHKYLLEKMSRCRSLSRLPNFFSKLPPLEVLAYFYQLEQLCSGFDSLVALRLEHVWMEEHVKVT